MAYSQTLDIVTEDTLPSMTFTLRDSNQAAVDRVLDPEDSTSWAPIDITDSIVKLRIRKLGETVLSDTRTGTVTNGAAGTVVIEFATATFPDPGTYEGEIEVTFPNGGVQTIVDLIKFKVREGFG